VSGSNAILLFAPSRQMEGFSGVNQLRLLSGGTDKRFTLPSPCVAAALHNRKIYAFSGDTVYRADVSAQRFTASSLPSEMGDKEVTGYLGMLSNGVALVSCDGSVYALTLP